jgi:hypothetical protein
MRIENACVECIINQSLKVAHAIEADESLEQKLLSNTQKLSKDFSFQLSPPEVASRVYEEMATLAQREDLYAQQKEEATKQALSFVPALKQHLKTSSNKLLDATKIAVAGNVIDLAAEVEFDLTEEIHSLFEREFAHNDFTLLQKQLKKAKKIVILGDNTGEHIFDYLFVETLQELYPKLSISYFVRGTPIINDVTMKEAKEVGFDTLCNLVDSGVNTPGFAYTRATQKAQELFDNADLVISKGMGNYECLSPSHRENIFFLLKVKCNVVALSLKQEVGDIICKRV